MSRVTLLCAAALAVMAIDGAAQLDARRADVGLPPMADYVSMLGEMTKLPVVWPPK